MSGVKISAVAEDTSVTGVELLPVSDNGIAKSVKISDIKDFAIDQIEAIAAGSAMTEADSVFILQGGVLKPVDISLIVSYATGIIWGKTAENAPDSADLMTLKDGSTEKTVTLAILAEYVRATIEAAILDVSNLTATSSIASDDKLLVTVGTTGKYVTYATLVAQVYSSLAAYVTELTAVPAGADGDVLYVLQGGVQKKITLEQIKTYIGIGSVAKAPEVTTADSLPQWANTTGTLKDGIVIATTVDDSGTHLEIPTSKAVYDAIAASADTNDATLNTDADISGNTWVIDEDDLDSDLDTKVPTQQSVKAYVDARILQSVDGTLATGDNTSFDPTKLVYNKTCSDSGEDDVIGLNDGTVIGQILTIYLGTKDGDDNAIITPATALSYATITLDAVNEIATLQWQGATVGWAILYSNGTIA
ncbi:MAG: hypothetical protein R6V06_00100 [Kiritimatiellia bacterium]